LPVEIIESLRSIPALAQHIEDVIAPLNSEIDLQRSNPPKRHGASVRGAQFRLEMGISEIDKVEAPDTYRRFRYGQTLSGREIGCCRKGSERNESSVVHGF
jgi:hypothetical protein